MNHFTNVTILISNTIIAAGSATKYTVSCSDIAASFHCSTFNSLRQALMLKVCPQDREGHIFQKRVI